MDTTDKVTEIIDKVISDENMVLVNKDQLEGDEF
jgi:hypothetical protein